MAIGYLIEERLRARTSADSKPDMNSPAHPDEDTICAFVEGRLETDESAPVVSHLISCGLCRRATAQLIRLEAQLDENDPATAAEGSPGRVRSFLDGLASRIIPTATEDAVFAYQDPETEVRQVEPTEPARNSEDPAADERS